MSKKEFKIGDVVKLNSGGPNLTVIKVTEGDNEVQVIWASDTGIFREWIPRNCVYLIRLVYSENNVVHSGIPMI